jgi:iron complex outermembrane receptor protein
MKKIAFVLLLVISSSALFAQGRGEIKGTVKDAATGETIIGAAVVIGAGKGTVTDIDGNYSIKADSGQYTLSVTYVGYEPQKLKIKVANKPVVFNFSLQTITLNEVEVVADVAKIRETPIAFSNISTKQIQEELASRDLPMLLNSTPGAYATEQGGGSGDARVSIRGFDQRNVAVLVDGVPVNDMENGQVYWSNWDGLGDVTRNVQVQRGLGASKLAIASVGGTMNIITKGIDAKKEISLKQEVMSDLISKTTLGFNTGQLKGGWGVTGAFAYKKGQGYVDENWTTAYAYFLKVQKRIGKHLISIGGNGAPQSHGQRADKLPVALYNRALAEKLGINVDSVYQNNAYTSAGVGEKGLRYNPHWGLLNGEPLNERVNYFHKPQINLSDFWTINKKLYLSTVAYASFGKGGGTRLLNVPSLSDRDPATSQLLFDNYYTQNTSSTDILYSNTLHKSTNIIQSSVNNHQWYGMLSSLNYQIDTAFSAIFGIDARYYRGVHYREVHNLLGGDYFVNSADQNQPGGTYIGDPNFSYAMKKEGDKIFTNYEGYVTWGGAFAQIEYKKKKWSSFFTASASQTGYQRRDFFQNKDLVLADTTILQAVGYGDTLDYKGTKYTNQSAEARYSETKRKWFLGYTFKGGANYNINAHQNVFMNVGYLKMAPRFALVFTSTNQENTKTKMQEVIAVEGGYGIKYPKFAANINTYYTDWRNKPLSEFPTIRIAGDDYYYQINGLNAIHKGLELDFVYKLLKNLDVEGLASFGDWTSKTTDQVYLFDAITDKPADTILFSAQGIHVGDASQVQLAGSLRYEFIKNLYVKARYTYFTKNYSNFNLLDLGVTYNNDGSIKTDNRNRDAWKMPDYGLLDIYAGYDFKYKKLRFTFTAGLLNTLNTAYITDAQNGSGFDATSALVYMGMGRRFNTGMKVTF